MYHAQIVPTAMIPEVRTLTALWVSFTISLVVLHVDLDPQQRVVEPTNDDLGRSAIVLSSSKPNSHPATGYSSM